MPKCLTVILFLIVLYHPGARSQRLKTVSDPVKYVNPLMGSQSSLALSNGNTYPTICRPFGMNTWAPQTGKTGDPFLYSYDANYIYGLRETHQPSLWVNDYGQFSLMPVTHRDEFTEESRKSWFSHKAEIAKPYYYSVYLADHHIKAEMTATERAAVFRFRYHETDSAYLVLDAFTKGSYVKIIPSENKIIGYSSKNSGGTPANFRNYFVLQFDKPFLNTAVWHENMLDTTVLQCTSDHAGTIVSFKLKKGEVLQVKVASSFISPEQAEQNLKEVWGDSFDQVAAKSKAVWNKELKRVAISGGTDEQFKTFYSCLYRMLIFPRKFYEINKEGKVVHYSPYNGAVLPGYMYTDSGFWDTFRAMFPFLNLMYPSISTEVMQALENTYKESGWLPEWSSPGHRDCMIGSHSAAVITDTYLKGIRGYDIILLYRAILKNTENVGPVSSVGRTGANYYNKLGYIPCNVDINQDVSRTLEYAYDDFTIWQLAKALKRPQTEIDLFAGRSMNYRNLFDPVTGLMRPKDDKGKFVTSFDPFRWGDHYTEGNSWHYSWSVFHDVEGLAKLMGGQKQLIGELDSIFTLPPVFDISYYKRGVIHLVREMQGTEMGQYAHGNEPMHHVIYMYNFGAPWKAQYHLREVMNKLYNSAPDGYCGDEDNGQMSAWYVFSAAGFYPLCPGTNQYVFGSPLFKQVVFTLESGKRIVINAPKNSADNLYIRRVKVNGKVYSPTWISHSDLVRGCVIDFDMKSKPNYLRGNQSEDFPYSFSVH